MKTIQIKSRSSEFSLSFWDESLSDDTLIIEDMLKRYKEGVLIFCKARFTLIKIDYRVQGKVLIVGFDEFGDMVFHQYLNRVNDAINDQLYSCMLLAIIPYKTDYEDIKSVELIESGREWLCKNKFGRIDYLDVQCTNKECICSGSGPCLCDEWEIEAMDLYQAYKKNMLKNRKLEYRSCQFKPLSTIQDTTNRTMKYLYQFFILISSKCVTQS